MPLLIVIPCPQYLACFCDKNALNIFRMRNCISPQSTLIIFSEIVKFFFLIDEDMAENWLRKEDWNLPLVGSHHVWPLSRGFVHSPLVLFSSV